MKGYHLRGQTKSRSGRLRGSIEKTEGDLCFFLPATNAKFALQYDFSLQRLEKFIGDFFARGGEREEEKAPSTLDFSLLMRRAANDVLDEKSSKKTHIFSNRG